jgi:uncharacterized protein DUF3857
MQGLSQAVLCSQLTLTSGFTARSRPSTLPQKRTMMKPCKVPVFFINALAVCFLSSAALSQSFAQEAEQKPAAKAAGQKAEKGDKSDKAENPAQIELLETKVRFETNGDSRKEVHALVKIHSELGVRQFAQLNFDFNRSFESVEIPLVHVAHASGGTSDILPSAVTDHPNPAVVNAPAYQDVRVKSVRILGLQPGDALEYRVIRTVSHHPLAPDFWLEHTFDRSGVVSQETYEVNLPASIIDAAPDSRRIEMRTNPATPATVRQETSVGSPSRTIYQWRVAFPKAEKDSGSQQNADVALDSFLAWGVLSQRLAGLFEQTRNKDSAVSNKAIGLTQTATQPKEKIEALYSFVSAKIATIDLPLEATGFRSRLPAEILSSGYASPEDKFVLLAALASSLNLQLEAALAGTSPGLELQLPSPSLFSRVLTNWGPLVWCDPGLDVAPFGLLPTELRGKKVFRVFNPPASNPLADVSYPLWFTVPLEPPFPALQQVHVDATLAEGGKLVAKVRYSMRGDNELLLRVAFHRSPKEKWKELAQLLSITDGFRGHVTSVTASDPYATKEPFSVEYELEQPKFVDWSKKPVRLPALLPQLSLPDSEAKPASGSATTAIELGTPLEVETRMTLQLPPGSNASAPTGTSIERDYATYTSQYSASGSTITASRHIKFILRGVAGARAADYNAFLRAVQSDEAQDFTIERSETSPSKTNSAAPNATAPPKTVPLKP